VYEENTFGVGTVPEIIFMEGGVLVEGGGVCTILCPGYDEWVVELLEHPGGGGVLRFSVS
jgi:hypothetical protein